MGKFKKLLTMGVLLATVASSTSVFAATTPDTKAQAPSVTKIQVLSVSSNTGTESIKSGQTVTKMDHQGPLTVVVEENGYSKNRSATFAGVSMTLSGSQGRDTNGDGVIDVWRRTYKRSQSIGTGTFKAFATPSSGNTLQVSTSLNIL